MPVVDDPGFLRDVIEETAQRFALDRKRVYLIGHSSGGFLCYRMACECADLIAGIASLAGSQAVDPSLCLPSEPVHILDIRRHRRRHGCLLGRRPYHRRRLPREYALCVPAQCGLVQMWAVHNGAQDPLTDPAPSVDLTLDVPGLDTVVTRYTQHTCPAARSNCGRSIAAATLRRSPRSFRPASSTGSSPIRNRDEEPFLFYRAVSVP